MAHFRGQPCDYPTHWNWQTNQDDQPLIDRLPKIDTFAQLKFLHIHGNRLIRLPPEIINLPKLRALGFENHDNILSLLPDITNLTHLTQLWLMVCHLTDFPIKVTRLTKLKMLDLRNNQLSTLLPEIGNLMKLKRLYLRNNQLSTLPPEIIKLRKLKRLWVEGNPLLTPPQR